MGVNGRGLGRFSFRPKSPQKGRGHLKHNFRLTKRLLPDSTMTYRGRSDGLVQGYSIGGPRSGSGPRRNQIWTEAKINILIKSWSKRVFIGASFHWCMISRCIFFSYSMWFLSSVSNPEVQSGAVITTSLWQLIHSMLAASSVGHAGCVCQWQQRGQIDLWTVACFSANENHGVL